MFHVNLQVLAHRSALSLYLYIYSHCDGFQDFTVPYRNYRAETIDPLLQEPMNVEAYQELVEMPEGAQLPHLFYHLLVIGDVLNKFVRVKMPDLSEEEKASKDGFDGNFWRIFISCR